MTAGARRMNWVDYAILAIIAISALISVLRGFMSEALSLLGWILSFWVALTFTEELGAFLAHWISVPSLRLGIAFFVLLISTLLLTALVNYLVGQLVEKTGLTGTDRVLGIVFGVARGAVVVAILVLLAGLTPFPRDPWWRESSLIVHFQTLAMEIHKLLPPEFAAYFSY